MSLVWTVGVVALSAYLIKSKLTVSQAALNYNNSATPVRGDITTNDIRNARLQGANRSEVRTLSNQNGNPIKLPEGATANFKDEAASYEIEDITPLEGVPVELAGHFF